MPKEFVDPETLFSIQVPNEWSIDTSGLQNTKVFLYHPNKEGEFRPNINIIVQSLGNFSNTDFLNYSRLQLKQIGQGVVDEPGQILPGSRILEYRMNMGMDLYGRQLIAFQQSKVFLVTATAPEDKFEKYREEFIQILDSFKFNS